MRLVKGLYGHEFKGTSNLFGLRCGQMTYPDDVHNGGWYNHLGQKLGWGDLSNRNMQRIAKELEPDEVFVVLPESASFWKFVRRPGLIGALADVDRRTEEEPGVDYIVEHCSWIIRPGMVYNVHYHAEFDKPIPMEHWRDKTFHFYTIGRNQAREAIQP